MILLRLLIILVPALGMLWVVWRTDPEREPKTVVLATAALGVAFGAVAFWLRVKASTFTHLDIEVRSVGEGMALLYTFAFAAPLGEAAKVAACWPAFRSRHFDEPYDGIVYASAAALGFATAESAFVMIAHDDNVWVWATRVLFALPAHVFFASAWGWGLGRAKQLREPGAHFPMLFIVAVVGHGFYSHLVYGRGPAALITAVPFLLAMGVIAFFFARDLRRLTLVSSRSRITELSIASLEALSRPPSLKAFREALRKRDRPIGWGWVALGVVVHLGGMVLGLAGAIAFGHFAHIDFSVVNERDVSTVGPVALLVAGLLAGFPVSGYLIARAGDLPTVFEPAVGSTLALVATMTVLGLVAPVAIVFALALAPIALGLSCAGAWVGRHEEV